MKSFKMIILEASLLNVECWLRPPCSSLFNQANKKIEDSKLARDFQTTLQEFQKVQQLASERESTYTPAAPSTSLPTSSGSGEESVDIDRESQHFIREQKR